MVEISSHFDFHLQKRNFKLWCAFPNRVPITPHVHNKRNFVQKSSELNEQKSKLFSKEACKLLSTHARSFSYQFLVLSIGYFAQSNHQVSNEYVVHYQSNRNIHCEQTSSFARLKLNKNKMSENLQQSQDQQNTQNLPNELVSIDQKYSDDVENGIYTQQYTAEFPTNERYYPCDECDNDPMRWWNCGHTSYYYANAKIQSDLTMVRDCFDYRMQMEEQAHDLILEIEAMVELMLHEYSRLFDDNQYLNDELRKCNDLIRANGDVTATTLQCEHEAIMKENVQLRGDHQQLMQDNDKKKDIEGSDKGSNELHDDLQIDFEHFRQQLAEKDETIKQLSARIDHLTVSPAQRSSSNESIHSNKTITNEYIPPNLSNTSDKIRLEKINMEIEAMFIGKLKQLLVQDAQIDELVELLEFKLKEMEEHRQILGQQLTLNEDQIAVLMDDREKLSKTNNDLMKSISRSQVELCKYEFL